MVDRLVHVLLTEVIVGESELRTLVIWVRSNHFFEIFLLLCHIAVCSGFICEDEKFLAFRNLVGKRHRFLLMIEEILGRNRIIGSSQFRGGEGRIERDGFVKVLERLLAEKPVGKIDALQEFLSRLI